MNDEPITIDALKGFVQPVHVRMIFKELDRREQPRPETAQCHPIQALCWANCYQTVQIIDGPEQPVDRVFPSLTVGGIPLNQNRAMKDDVVEFVRGGRIVAKIFNLAKPPGL